MNKQLQSVEQLTTALRLKQLNYNELFKDGLTPLESVEIYLKEQLRLREERATEFREKRSRTLISVFNAVLQRNKCFVFLIVYGLTMLTISCFWDLLQ